MRLLDLVALGTVADVALLRGLNRAFVTQGLKIMARRDRIGMAALIAASRITRPPQSSDTGFTRGPRTTAGGRVGDPTMGVSFTTPHNTDEAGAIAAKPHAPPQHP